MIAERREYTTLTHILLAMLRFNLTVNITTRRFSLKNRRQKEITVHCHIDIFQSNYIETNNISSILRSIATEIVVMGFSN